MYGLILIGNTIVMLAMAMALDIGFGRLTLGPGRVIPDSKYSVNS